MNKLFNQALITIGRKPQRQDGLNAQLDDMTGFIEKHRLGTLSFEEQQVLATRLGMYDAADYIKKLCNKPSH
jgi:hypothetical protein